jgi:CelD/BcsL family acetyltransferase involved in cellulose biosynthesis
MSCCAPCSAPELLDESAVLEHAGAWDDLLRRSYDNRIYYTSHWQRAWWRHFGDATARVLAIRDIDRFCAILPLQERDGVLTLLGDYNVADYMDALAERPDATELLTDLWHAALAALTWDRVELRHVPSASPILRAISEAAERLGHVVAIESDEVCPVALLCSSWDRYLQMLSKKQRHEIRRKLRRAEEGAEVDWRTVRDHHDLARDLPVFFRLHEASAREKAGFMTGRMRGFFQDLAADLLDRGQLRLSVLRRDGIDIAASMSFLYRDRWLLYNSGYDPAYAAYSPGIAAVAYAMQDAIREEAIAFDFLSGDEPYKYQFGATNTHTCRVLVTRR